MQQGIVFGIGGLVLGLVIGFFAANSLNRPGYADAVQPGFPADTSPNEPGSAAAMGDVAETLDRADKEPDNFAAQMMAGDMFAKIGNLDRAIEYYGKGLAMRSEDPAGNLVIANAYFDAGRFEEAGNHYAKVLAIDPDNFAARTDLGTTFVERPSPDYDRAIAEFERVLKTHPDHEPTLYNLAIAYHRKGDVARAQEISSRLSAAHPASPLIAKLRQNLEPK